MLIESVALVSETTSVTERWLTRVGAALQKQALRDFGPLWNRRPTVDAFVSLDDVPLGYWPIIVKDNIDTPGAAGVHLDQDGQPLALVQYSDSWSLTASHECLEMLADPFGNRLIAGPSRKADQGRVEYLVEVCDPSEDAQFGYQCNGIMVSDFYTPHFFDPVTSSGVRYSFTGSITEPRDVLQGGYLSWHDPISDHWWQQTYFGASPTFRDLGVFSRSTESLRELVDTQTVVAPIVEGLKPDNKSLITARAAGQATAQAGESKAASWRQQIEEIVAQASARS